MWKSQTHMKSKSVNKYKENSSVALRVLFSVVGVCTHDLAFLQLPRPLRTVFLSLSSCADWPHECVEWICTFLWGVPKRWGNSGVRHSDMLRGSLMESERCFPVWENSWFGRDGIEEGSRKDELMESEQSQTNRPPFRDPPAIWWSERHH